MGGCRQRGDVSVPPKGSGPKPRPGEVGPVEALGRPTGHEWKGTASLSMQRDPMGTDGDPWPQGEVRATPGQTVRAADARARQTRPSLPKPRFLVPTAIILIQEIWARTKNLHFNQNFTLSPR